ncbi:MAG: DUF4339 domain-containing protein, partial [Chthoniobacteraceae bacterium]
MDILILRDGQQIGPFTDERVRALLRDGAAQPSDMAWRTGMTEWQPLRELLGADTAPPVLAPVAADEPATLRQKAFLAYLHVPIPGELSKTQAAIMLHDAMESPQHAMKIKSWDRERLRLHPDIFAEEIKARKENRAQHFLEICHGEGREYFHDVGKAHAQVLVSYLDVHHPNWDERTNAERYFFAAIAEKFPQLVRSSARGQIKYPDGLKVADEMERSGVAVRPRAKRSPVVAALRGVGFGALVLAALYGVAAFYERHGVDWLQTAAEQSEAADVPLPAATPEPKVVEASPATPAPVEAVAQVAPATPAPTPEPAPAPLPEAAPTAPMTTAVTPTPPPLLLPGLLD